MNLFVCASMTNWQQQNVMWIAWLSESLNANGVWLLAEDCPSERRLHIRSWDVITFAWRVTKYGGSLWERSAHDCICRKDRTCVWKIFVAILILLSTRFKQLAYALGSFADGSRYSSLNESSLGRKAILLTVWNFKVQLCLYVEI